MYNEIDKYIINCIKQNKRMSGKKIKNLEEKIGVSHSPLEILYCEAMDKEIPFCKACNETRVNLISVKKGFRKYCSDECYRKEMSRRNTIENSKINKKRSVESQKQYEHLLKIGESIYLSNENITIKEVADRLDIPKNRIASHLREKKLTDKERCTKNYRKSLVNRLGDACDFLKDIEWVLDKIENEKWTSKIFAERLGCSKNFVCVKLRENGLNLSNFHINSSSYEIMISDFLDDIGVYHVKNDRSVLNGKEIDIFIPDKKVGIEINGIYWHQDYDGEKRNYHLKKTEIAETQSVRLLHFTDKEIDENFEMVKNIIKSSIGVNEKIYARKTQVKELTSKEFSEFVSKNHFQGSINSSVRYGLFIGGEIVSAMGFAKSRFNKNYDYEVTRFCNVIGYNVVGGASKMFSKFKKDYENASVISYCDRRFFLGSVYEKMGMEYLHSTPPNYIWVDNSGLTLSRYKTQRHLLKDCPENLSESEYMRGEGFMKIYDSGQKVYAYKNTG